MPTTVADRSANIGQPLARVDGKLKVTGTATYAAEFARPKLAYGMLIQSAIANGRVEKIDVTAAKCAPGESRVPLQDDEIHYAGQHLGVVVAESFEEAVHAASLIRATYQAQLPI